MAQKQIIEKWLDDFNKLQSNSNSSKDMQSYTKGVVNDSELVNALFHVLEDSNYHEKVIYKFFFHQLLNNTSDNCLKICFFIANNLHLLIFTIFLVYSSFEFRLFIFIYVYLDSSYNFTYL